MKEMLRALTDIVAISGEEERGLIVIKDLFDTNIVSIDVDKQGSIIIHKKGDRPGKVWMSAHMDEIGLIVTKVDGPYIRFTEVGGYDEKVLYGQEVIVFGDKQYNGIVGAKPPHLMTRDEYDKMLGFNDLFIDLGRNEAFVKKHVHVGDRIVIRHKYTELKNNNISTKSMDNRSCGAIIMHALKQLMRVKGLPDIYVVLNAQEETTFLGASTASYSINPDVAFVTDVTIGKQPGVTSGYDMDTVMIAKGAHIAPMVFEHLKKTAEDNNIKYGIEAVPRASGTDTGAVQLARGGVSTGLVSLPLKNMHSPVETGNLDTMKNASLLLSRAIMNINIDDFAVKTIK